MNDYQFFQRQWRRAYIIFGAVFLAIVLCGCSVCLLFALAG